MAKVSTLGHNPMFQYVPNPFFHPHISNRTFRHSRMRHLATFLLHLALLRPQFLIHLPTGSLLPLPVKQQQKIFVDLLVVSCATPTLILIWSAWNRMLLVIVM